MPKTFQKGDRVVVSGGTNRQHDGKTGTIQNAKPPIDGWWHVKLDGESALYFQAYNIRKA